MSAKDLTVRIVSTDTVRPSTYNPRKADKERLAMVGLSLRKFGWMLPIYADPDGEILSGHQRHFVAVEMLGATKIPVVTTRKMPERQRMSVNVLYNRVTNDLKKTDNTKDMREALLSSQQLLSEIDRLPDLPIDEDDWFPVARTEMLSTIEVCEANELWTDQHALRMVNGLRSTGLPPMPIVITASGKVVNGLARLTDAAREGADAVECCIIPDEVGELARLMLNRISMDFNMEERYADFLRHNSFRRAHNHQDYLVHTHVDDLLRRGRKTVADGAKTFDQNDPVHIEAYKRHYGSTVLDFGAGRLDQVHIFRKMGLDAVGFEPFYIGEGGGDVNPDASRALATEFLERISTGLEFDSIFLSAVMNSVPFEQDRLHIVNLIAALSTERTAVHASSVSVKSARYEGATTGNIIDGGDTMSAGFRLDYEDNITVSDVSSKPKVQKFHTQNEWELLWRRGFSRVDGYYPTGLVAVVARKPKPVSAADLKAAIEFEFDVAYPDGTRMGLVKAAKEAFAARKKTLKSA
jgi:hypothetical protein